jgi:superfamily II DNA or RNA helicase
MTKSILHFNGVWRSYQKRILDDLDFHLRDSKLHIVAAPGAGKTTLGIEVISRLNRASLMLCPTNTIKNQWKERIQTSFLQKKDFGIVSTDIHNPSFLTIVTYQALLAAFCGHNDDESEDCQPDKEDGKEYAITNSSRFQMVMMHELYNYSTQKC